MRDVNTYRKKKQISLQILEVSKSQVGGEARDHSEQLETKSQTRRVWSDARDITSLNTSNMPGTVH